LADPAGDVRATALGALQRMGRLEADDVEKALRDPDPVVRRRACEVSAPVPLGRLVGALGDPEQLVVDGACFALGERGENSDGATDAVSALSRVAVSHKDPLCREAAIAALGAIGDPAGLSAILHGIDDKPAVRRRAVIALSPFDGPEVDEALERARSDRDWQVRQAAEDLS
ncbi:MAG: HEAT repeat domain-containing protein, partial [Acidimicrobiales bacterium]